MSLHSPNTGSGEDGGEGVPAEVIEDLLSSGPRRRLLAALAAANEPVPVDDLAVLLATGELSGSASRAERRRARTEIYQDHLPKLTATGAVAFDSLLGTVEFTGGPGLRARLSAVAGTEGQEGADGS